MLSFHGVALKPSRIHGSSVAQVVAQDVLEGGFRIRNIILLRRGAQLGCRGGRPPLHLCHKKHLVALVNTRFFASDFFASGYFHELSTTKRLEITLGSFQTYLKICVAVLKSRCTTNIHDTGRKFATSVNCTGGKFASGINNTVGKFSHPQWQIMKKFSDYSAYTLK